MNTQSIRPSDRGRIVTMRLPKRSVPLPSEPLDGGRHGIDMAVASVNPASWRRWAFTDGDDPEV